MKKIIYGVLVTLTAISLIACSGDKKSEKKSEKESEVKEEVKQNKDSDIEGDYEIDMDSYSEYDDYIEDESVKGKKFSELYDEGYNYTGYSGFGGSYEFYLEKSEVDDEIKSKVEDLEGMTVKEFINSDFYEDISYIGINGEYTFTSNIGGVYFSFELDGSAEIMALYDDEFVDVEDMEELYDKELTNVSVDYMEYILILDESANEIVDSDDFEEEMLDDCTVVKCCYAPID